MNDEQKTEYYRATTKQLYVLKKRQRKLLNQLEENLGKIGAIGQFNALCNPCTFVSEDPGIKEVGRMIVETTLEELTRRMRVHTPHACDDCGDVETRSGILCIICKRGSE